MADDEKRAALLKELAEYASAELVADSARLCSDAEIEGMVAGAKAQLADYAAAGFEDMKAKG
jgi:hypothetical protein